jgi:hypothetical protein
LPKSRTFGLRGSFARRRRRRLVVVVVVFVFNVVVGSAVFQIVVVRAKAKAVVIKTRIEIFVAEFDYRRRRRCRIRPSSASLWRAHRIGRKCPVGSIGVSSFWRARHSKPNLLLSAGVVVVIFGCRAAVL